MTFRVITNPEFTHIVTIDVPVDGGHRQETLKARFKFDTDAGQPGEGADDFLRRVLVSLDDLADAEGKPIPYNDEVRDQCLALPYVKLALVRAYNAALMKARSGN